MLDHVTKVMAGMAAGADLNRDWLRLVTKHISAIPGLNRDHALMTRIFNVK